EVGAEQPEPGGDVVCRGPRCRLRGAGGGGADGEEQVRRGGQLGAGLAGQFGGVRVGAGGRAGRRRGGGEGEDTDGHRPERVGGQCDQAGGASGAAGTVGVDRGAAQQGDPVAGGAADVDLQQRAAGASGRGETVVDRA